MVMVAAWGGSVLLMPPAWLFPELMLYFNRCRHRVLVRQLSQMAAPPSPSTTASTPTSIKALVEQGRYTEALQLHSVNPLSASRFAYPTLLKACASLSNLEYGKIIHSTVITLGFYSDPFLTTSLINLYCKCGSLAHAVYVFDKLPDSKLLAQDITIWNSIIDGYFRFGLAREGIRQFCRMQSSYGVRPDAYSLCILLGDCHGHLGCAYGKQIHGYAVRNLFKADPFLETALLDMYFTCGRPLDAWCFFNKLEDKHRVVAWNVVIGGFGANGLWESSLEAYSLAKNENVKLVSSSSLTSTLGACSQGGYLSFGEEVHSDVVKMGYQNDRYVSTSLLTMYAKCNSVEDAEEVFNQVVNKEIELWNAMISAYVGNSCESEALEIYRQMKLIKILPDSCTMCNVLSSCSMVGLHEFGRMIHTELVKRPIDSNVKVQSALLTLYSKCGCDNDANLIFKRMEDRDVIAWGSLISGFSRNNKYMEALDSFKAMEQKGVKPDSDVMSTVITACTGLGNADLGSMVHGSVIKSALELDAFVACSVVDMYSKCGFPELAEKVFSDMPLKNLVAWNSMISCYYRNDLPELSISLFSKMVCDGLCPDSVSVTCVLVAISTIASLLKGKAVHAHLIRLGMPSHLQVENALVDMYIKCGFLKYASYIFNIMPEKSLITWNSIIAGYGSHGECLEAMKLFDKMRITGITPDDVTFLSLLSSCNHSGLIKEGLSLFQLMTEDYGIEPRMEHYVNIVDLLGRAGRLDDACTFVKSMPIEPERSIWLSLLFSCRAHCNIELGEVAANELLKIEPSRGSNYVQLLNLYGEAERWDRAAELRASMKERGLKKNPGCSWIEVRNKVEVFLSGHCSSSRAIDIYEALNSLNRNMAKKEGDYENPEAFEEGQKLAIN